mmetsp:Transcript_38002/g.119942  ORF Transcript_38002/g.119942 Transcript_38002/m.119942 type:complete len:255 (+) Transcript_38002:642-1406(+)
MIAKGPIYDSWQSEVGEGQRHYIVSALTGEVSDLGWRPDIVEVPEHSVMVLLVGWSLVGAGMDRASLSRRCEFQGKTVTVNVSLELADLSKASLAGATLDGAIIRRGTLTEANLSNASLISADLCKSTLTNANFYKSKCDKAYLEYTILTGASLHWAQLEGASLKHIQCDGARFNQAKLKEVSFRWSFVGGANFTRTRLDGADFTGAVFKGTDLPSKRPPPPAASMRLVAGKLALKAIIEMAGFGDNVGGENFP